MTKSLTENDAATLLGCTVSCLRAWRYRKQGPAFTKVGKLVRYLLEDVVAFQRQNRVDFGAVLDRETYGDELRGVALVDR